MFVFLCYLIRMKDKKNIINADKLANIVRKVCAKHNNFHNFRSWELGSNISDYKKPFKIN
jgi:hypothetical protein